MGARWRAGIAALAGGLALSGASLARYQLHPGAGEVTIASRPYRPGPTFQAGADLVQVEAVVRRSNGEAVDNLTARDFAVHDNGKLQTITQFSLVRRDPTAALAGIAPPIPGAPAPAPAATSPVSPTSIGFFLDDADTATADLIHAREAVRSFVASGLPPGNQIAIATVSSFGSIEFTRDATNLDAALNQVSAHPLVSGGCPPLTGFEAERIVNRSDYDLITAKANEAVQMQCGCSSTSACIPKVRNEAEFVAQLAKEQTRRTLQAVAALLSDLARRPGKRVVVFASGGFFLNFDLRPEMDRLIAQALRNGIVVDALDAKGVATESAFDISSPDRGMGGRFGAVPNKEEIMEQFHEADGMSDLAWSTGGSFFQGSNDLRRGIRDLAAPPAVAYLLGFVPTDLKPDGSTHTLKVTVAGHYKIQARHGYIAPDRVSGEASARNATLRREAASREPQTGIAFRLGIGRYPQGTSRLTVTFDPHTLPLQHANGRNRDQIEIIAAVFDPHGTFVTGLDTTVQLNLLDATLRRFTHPGDGIEVAVPIAAPPGSYLLRVAAVESQKGRIGADFRPLVLTP